MFWLSLFAVGRLVDMESLSHVADIFCYDRAVFRRVFVGVIAPYLIAR